MAGPATCTADTDRREDNIVILGNIAGSQTVNVRGTNGADAEYSFNDRGRGDHIKASWILDKAGLPIQYSGSGNDYMKAPIAETFRLQGNKAFWRNPHESGERTLNAPAFYVPSNAPPEMLGVLARALLRSPSKHLALLPAGEASIELADTVPMDDVAGKTDLLHYRISGLNFLPQSVWLSRDGQTVASLSAWFSTLAIRYREALPKLWQIQSAADDAWSARLAREQTRTPNGNLVIRHARLFDPRDLSVRPGTSVEIRAGRIVRISPDGDLASAAEDEVIDARGQFLMPGLWDNHAHIMELDGALDILNGVTSVRDLANDLEIFPKRVARFDAGTELGPRVFKAGIIDGTGPFAGPTTMRADTLAEAIEDVEWYADHGYGQIKIYSSMKPQFVSHIAEAAHARGLRVSGHVPAFMNAQQFVSAGADEIQHINFIVLNFLFDTEKETRNMNRFTAVAEHARDIQVEDPKVREFIGFLKEHHTVLDPTMNIFESFFSADAGAPPPGLEAVVARFPPQARRTVRSQALAVPKGKEAIYRDAFPALLRLLKSMYDAGITILPGTDAPAGYTLHHELELYARAGIPPAEVLRMATLTSAQVSGLDSQRGVIAAGKQADMILVDGDPTMDISAIRNVTTVIKDGKIFDPAKIESALGMSPRTHSHGPPH